MGKLEQVERELRPMVPALVASSNDEQRRRKEIGVGRRIGWEGSRESWEGSSAGEGGGREIVAICVGRRRRNR
ncbi:hypothetical protein DVH24_015945 [Malus domestica]|uniref:Uncharacterized protein n=1 Tax=Malus domestica TaxID=3750 RepID=A0A498JDU3_MALDO|nr:hypothetical protein DVH24_015945 [Malus domestica]